VIQCGGGAPVDAVNRAFQNFTHVMLHSAV
jgi:hypothetical protein